ncbi:PREDICTED: pentatricopeptide repeat-containing protein At1g08070, chloroplastic [Tarenaya hassleriana]|uniref:pentatricopeptide repeat-containing protein At1g08070, chloroplastic n=1 Tax=Tarenaya hassleriana TaxID=28532 RepID=UPI00053C1109|nr:PREDICTED: pentatricopeptide repeat-containing protein At1g08070, chloroplastic [Tarenaya hassleriana]
MLLSPSPCPTLPSHPPHFLPSSSDPPYEILRCHASLLLLRKCKTLQSLRQIHAQMIKTGLHNTNYGLSKLIEFCVLSRFSDGLPYAVSIFETIQEPNLLIWNTMIRGHSLSSSSISALQWYVRMISLGLVPNSYTFPFVLKSCAKSGAIREGKQVHGHVLKHGLDLDLYVHTSLISMYAQNGELEDAHMVFDNSPHRDAVSFTAIITGYASKGCIENARKLFDEIPVRDVVSWNAMISGYVETSRYNEALELFKEMIEVSVTPDESTMVSVLSACAKSGDINLCRWVHSWICDHHHGFSLNLQLVNALIDMYSKCGDIQTARDLFEGLSQRDVISWNIMIGGYTRMNVYKESLLLFQEMLRSGESPNDVTMLSILPACAHLGATDIGKWVHVYIDKKLKNIKNPSLRTSLIDMYAKCGNIEAAKQVFGSTGNRSLASWNAMISGFAMHGRADAAFDLFSRMKENGIEPDDITFVGLLSACSHAGLLELGHRIFKSMTQEYRISPKLEHYGCVIDLLGRSGKFKEAEEVIEGMGMEPDGAIWGSLLKACRIHGNIEMGESIAENLFKVEPENPGAYILLSNIYASAGRWNDVARIRSQLNDKGMKKIPGCSSIEIESVVHEFLIGDQLHPRHEEIYKMLDEIDTLLEKSGFVPDKTEVLQEMDEEWKEGALRHHSEKLAIAFGLISTKPGTKLTIVKNLRVCRNCHEATKLISKIFGREIIARDRNRFHHFRDGVCSCNDYW